MFKVNRTINFIGSMPKLNLRQNKSVSRNTQNYMFKQFSQSSSSVGTLKSIDDLPGDFEMHQHEQMRLFPDATNLFNEKYEIAKKANIQPPMIKMNVFGTPSILLFSHDLIKQYQRYELQGQTQRTLPPLFNQLIGRTVEDMYGRTHLNWRKKAIKSFRPEMVDQYTPFIQKSVNDIVLSGIAEESERKGDYVYFCELAKKFAFQVGIIIIPFATGLHKCLGIHLAKLELKIYTTLLLRDWEFEIDEDKLKDEKESIYEMNLANGFAHYNVYLKMHRKVKEH